MSRDWICHRLVLSEFLSFLKTLPRRWLDQHVYLNGTNHCTHAEQDTAIGIYNRSRNQQS